jgi:hypothetical protein
LLIGCPTVALCLPQHLAERLHEFMLSRMYIAEPGVQLLVKCAYPGWPVYGDLVANRQVQSHM